MNIATIIERSLSTNDWHHRHWSHYKAEAYSLFAFTCLFFARLDTHKQVKPLDLYISFFACVPSLIQTNMNIESSIRQTCLNRSLPTLVNT